MATYRIGIGTDFKLNGGVGIGTDTAPSGFGDLKVGGTLKTEDIDMFLNNKVDGENFNKFIVIKDSKNGPYLSWVKVGVSDLYNVEIIEGLTKGDVVYILPSKSLFDYQERFKERVSGSFSFG